MYLFSFSRTSNPLDRNTIVFLGLSSLEKFSQDGMPIQGSRRATDNLSGSDGACASGNHKQEQWE
jgi:hypothetical protein